jgi:hypothetical protein
MFIERRGYTMAKKTPIRNPNSGGVKIPDDVKVRTAVRLERCAERHFKGRYTRLEIKVRGQFCYVDAYREPGPHVYVPKGMSRADVIEQQRTTPIHLFRLRYFGDENAWAFGFFKYSDEKYETSMFQSGDFFGTPEEALEIAAGVYLND